MQQEVQQLRLEHVERMIGILVEGQAATLKTMQQNANQLDELSNRVDSLSNQVDALSGQVAENAKRLGQVSEQVGENTKRLDKLERYMVQILDDLAIIKEKLAPPRMGFAVPSDD